MSEYRHIANLTGPQGEPGQDATATPGTVLGNPALITGDTDWNNIDPGVYYVASPGATANIGLPVNRWGSVEVMQSSGNSRVARFSSARLEGQGLQVFQTSAGTGGTWDEWEEVHNGDIPPIKSEGVNRIIATKDAEHPMEDGDVLVLIDTPSYFTDFTGEAYGIQPSGWTRRWVEATHTIESEPNSSNGRVLSFAGGSGSSRRAISWNLLDGLIESDQTIEVAFKWRGSDVAMPRAVTHGSGDSDTASGATGGVASSQNSTILLYDNGQQYTYTSNNGDTAPAPGEWWASRFRVHPGQRITIKSWKWGTPEPHQWLRVAPPAVALTPGWVGLVSAGAGWTQYDWIGVAFDGGRAPLGG